MRVLSHHAQIRACVGDEVVDVTFHPTFLPGVYSADLDAVVAHHLVTNIGEVGGFWEDADVSDEILQSDTQLTESDDTGDAVTSATLPGGRARGKKLPKQMLRES